MRRKHDRGAFELLADDAAYFGIDRLVGRGADVAAMRLASCVARWMSSTAPVLIVPSTTCSAARPPIMLGGLQAFGALGIILGPVLFATTAAILDVLREMPRSRALRAEVSEQQVV